MPVGEKLTKSCGSKFLNNSMTSYLQLKLMKNLVNKIRSWTEAPDLEQIPESLRENAISISTVSCPEKFLAPMSHHDSMIFFDLGSLVGLSS